MAVNFNDNAILAGGTVDHYFTNTAGNYILVRCTVANIPTGAGYAVGCLLQATDTGNNYVNTGTTTTAAFTLLDAGTAFGLPTSATDTSTTTGTSLALTQNTVTSGKGFTQSLNGLTTGFGHSITHTTAVIASGGSLQNISSTSIDTSTTTGILQNLSSTASLAGTQTLHTYSGLTTGIGDSLVVNALTTGVGNSISHTTSVIASGGSLQRISSTSIDTGTTTGVLQDLSSTASLAGTQRLLTASALTTGIADSIVVAALTTGIGHKVTATAATLTTGRYYSANDGTSEVFGVGLNGHLISVGTAAAPSAAITTNQGISAVALTAGATDTCGTITTTGTQNNTADSTFTVTFGKTYTTAPKAVVLTPANAAAALAAQSGAYISSITATTFVVGVSKSSAAAATPSWNYIVIA